MPLLDASCPIAPLVPYLIDPYATEHLSQQVMSTLASSMGLVLLGAAAVLLTLGARLVRYIYSIFKGYLRNIP